VRGAIGAKSIELDFEERATVGDVLDALAARSESDFPTDAVVMRDRRHLDRETTIAGGDVVSVTDSPMPEG
jgi:molybdopterin converting factor small subunit